MTLSDKIQLIRKEKGLKVAQLAERTQVSDDAVRAWERGTRVPELDNLIKLADAFEVSLDVFRQDALNLDLPHPLSAVQNSLEKADELTANGIPLKFGSTEPNEQQKSILDFCNAYLETLDSNFFIKGVGQNSEYGTGRYFWESKIDLLLWIGFTPSLQKENPDYALSVAVNTETPLSEDIVAECNALQITDNAEENWVYVPINAKLEKLGGRYTKALREAADSALVTTMKIARKSLESTMQKFIMLKATENHTKQSAFAQ